MEHAFLGAQGSIPTPKKPVKKCSRHGSGSVNRVSDGLLFSQKPWFAGAFVPDSPNVIQHSPTLEGADQLNC
jgi:hypothetical protein